MKRVVTVVVLVLTVGLGGWMVWRYYEGQWPFPPRGASEEAGSGSEDTSADGLEGSRPVVALAALEPAGGVIELSGIPGDRLNRLRVREGSKVEAGDTLATLESRGIRKLEVALIESQKKEAKARSAAEEQLANARIEAAKLGVEKAQMQDMDVKSLNMKIQALDANLKLATEDRDRLVDLRKLPADDGEELVSEQELERQKLLVRQAEVELAAANADLEKLNRTRDLTLAAALADLHAAEAGKGQVQALIALESLERRSEMAKAQLAQTRIRAPTKGTILKVFVVEGESIGAMPILQMADLDEMVAVAQVYETDVKRVHLGQSAVVKSEAFEGQYAKDGIRGKVVQIGSTVATPELKSLDPFARADRHVVAVRVALDEEGSRQAAKLVNLQVEVTFVPIWEDDQPPPAASDSPAEAGSPEKK
jgi:HlyD family secretion protein